MIDCWFVEFLETGWLSVLSLVECCFRIRVVVNAKIRNILVIRAYQHLDVPFLSLQKTSSSPKKSSFVEFCSAVVSEWLKGRTVPPPLSSRTNSSASVSNCDNDVIHVQWSMLYIDSHSCQKRMPIFGVDDWRSDDLLVVFVVFPLPQLFATHY